MTNSPAGIKGDIPSPFVTPFAHAGGVRRLGAVRRDDGLAPRAAAVHDGAVGESAGAIDVRDLRGVKPLRKLLPLLASLHDVGCGRDRAGNRDLHFDQYVTLVLLMLLNPLIDSVRALQHAASVEKVSARLGVKRFSLGSFSESVRCFDPGRLKGVVRQLCGSSAATCRRCTRWAATRR